MLRSLSGPLDGLAQREKPVRVELTAPAVWLPVVALCAVGLGIRLLDYTRGMWEDELTLAYYTQVGIKNVIPIVAQNGSHPPLYFLLAAVDSHFGLDVLPAIRLPSLVAGVATIAVMYLLTLRLAGRAAAVAAGALTTFAPVAIWYSDEGRMYAVLWFLVLTSYLLLVWGHDSRFWRVFAVLHGITVGLALWTDYSAALALAPQLLLILLLRHRGWFLASWVAGWLSIVPWVFFLREQYGRIQAQTFPNVANDFKSWWNVILDVAGVHADYASLGNTIPEPALIAVLVLLAAAMAATLVASWRGRLRLAAIVASLTAGALVIGIALAFRGVEAVVVARVMGIITFGFVLAFAGAVGLLVSRDSRAGRILAIASVAVVLGCAVASSANLVQNGTNGVKWDGVANTIQTNAQPGDELIFYPIATRYAVTPYLPASSPWRNDFDGAWPKSHAEAEQSFATWIAGKTRVWFVFYALAGVDMPVHDAWFVQQNLCRVMGDPNESLGVIEYEANTTHC